MGKRMSYVRTESWKGREELGSHGVWSTGHMPGNGGRAGERTDTGFQKDFVAVFCCQYRRMCEGKVCVSYPQPHSEFRVSLGYSETLYQIFK